MFSSSSSISVTYCMECPRVRCRDPADEKEKLEIVKIHGDEWRLRLAD